MILGKHRSAKGSRRLFLAALAGLSIAIAGLPATAQEKTLTIVAHAVHEAAATGEKGGNPAGAFAAENKVKLRWLTYGVVPLHEQLFREASLSNTSVDVAFLLNRFTNESVVNLFEPLDGYIAADPIEDMEGISAGMRQSMTFGGKLYGIPFRHATDGLLYNEELFSEVGLKEPPKTFEQLVEYARKLTYKRPDGTQVYGLVLSGQGSANIIDIVRAYGGDFITPDLKVAAGEPGMVKSVQLLVDLFKEGVLPRDSLSFTTEDATTYMQQGRAAMAIDPFSRFATLNDSKKSKFPGKIAVAPVPPSEAVQASGQPVAVKTEVWSLVIPKNSANKELAWQFIKTLSSPKGTIAGALNGNGPTRESAYDDPAVQAAIPYWAAEKAAVAAARVPIPGFTESARADDILIEEVQAAMLGSKTAQEAMDSVVARVTPLLPAK